MSKKYVLFNFAVENVSIPESDDAVMRLGDILAKHGVRGTMKIVGKKARIMKERGRHDVIKSLGRHAIGYHSDMHINKPDDYLGPFGWLDGAAEFEKQERRGIDDILAIWNTNPVGYANPGGNWAPQAFPVLRKWEIPTYLCNCSYVDIDAQPFWFGGLLNVQRLNNTVDKKGRKVVHGVPIGFEVGSPGALDTYKQKFSESYNKLEDGGLIAIANHPCQLVQVKWFCRDTKPPELKEAGYKDFEDFVSYILSHKDIATVTADQLIDLYHDSAMGHMFTPDELLAMAKDAGEKVNFRKSDGMTLSAAEMFGMFAYFTERAAKENKLPSGETCRYLDGPAESSGDTESGFSVKTDDFLPALSVVCRFMEMHGRLPNSVSIANRKVSPKDFYGALARTLVDLVEQGKLPDEVAVKPLHNEIEQVVDEENPLGFPLKTSFSPNFVRLARLQTWTLKPAILQQ